MNLYSPLLQNIWCAGPGLGFRRNVDLPATQRSVELVMDDHINLSMSSGWPSFCRVFGLSAMTVFLILIFGVCYITLVILPLMG